MMLTIWADRFVSAKIDCPSAQPIGRIGRFEIPSESPTDRMVDHHDKAASFAHGNDYKRTLGA